MVDPSFAQKLEPFEEFEKREREFDKRNEEERVAEVKQWRSAPYGKCVSKFYETAYRANPPSELDFILGGGVSSAKWVIWYLAAFLLGYSAVDLGSKIAKRYFGWLTR